jgi:hypothetical protein
MHFLPILLALLPSLTLVTAIPITTMPIRNPNSVDEYCRAAAYHQVEANKLQNQVVLDPHAAGLVSEHLNRVDQHLEAAVKVAGDQATVRTGPDLYPLHPHANAYHSDLGADHYLYAVVHAHAANRARKLYRQGGEYDISPVMKDYVSNKALSDKHMHFVNHHYGIAKVARVITTD